MFPLATLVPPITALITAVFPFALELIVPLLVSRVLTSRLKL